MVDNYDVLFQIMRQWKLTKNNRGEKNICCNRKGKTKTLSPAFTLLVPCPRKENRALVKYKDGMFWKWGKQGNAITALISLGDHSLGFPCLTTSRFYFEKWRQCVLRVCSRSLWLCPELWWSSCRPRSSFAEPLPVSTGGVSPTFQIPPSRCHCGDRRRKKKHTLRT